MIDIQVILFKNYKGQKTANKLFWNGFVEEYNNRLDGMDDEECFQSHNEALDPGYDGIYQSGNFLNVWKKVCKEEQLITITANDTEYRTTDYLELHGTPNTIVVFDWITFTSLDFNILSFLFTSFKGKILVDDSFESHPLRNDVMANHLENNLKYDANKIGFFTNCPRLDGVVKTRNLFKNDWLHLTMLTEFCNPETKVLPTTLQPLEKEKLIDYDNKEHLFLMLNGHTTKQRVRQLASLWFYDLLDTKVKYSVCDVGADHWVGFQEQLEYYNINNTDFSRRIYNKLLPKRLKNDIESGRERDMYVQTDWWSSTFYNLNVDTNQNYWKDYSTFHDGSKYYVNVSEKWLKQILYYTPGINTNEYTRLEKHIDNLGFKSYDVFAKEYDITESRHKTADIIGRLISDLEKPTRTEWNAMMEVADFNYNHLFKEHLPRLEESFITSITELLEQ